MLDVDSPVLNLGSFCTGVGLLDISVQLACEHVGIRTRSVFACEFDAYAAAVLRCRMEEKSLEPCPIFAGDLRDFPAESFRGLVDAAAFGFPCTDISCAGKGTGIRGKRSGLFFDILAKCCDMGCRILFLENVGALTVRGLDTVLGRLSDCGFDVEWTCLSAAAVGASHRRVRWFCLAYRPESRGWRLSKPNGWNDAANTDRDREAMDDSYGGRAGQQRESSQKDTDRGRGRSKSSGRRRTLADAEQPRLGGERLSRTGPDGRSEVVGSSEAVGHAASDDERRNSESAMHWQGESPRGSSGYLGDTNEPPPNARSETSGPRSATSESWTSGPHQRRGTTRTAKPATRRWRRTLDH